MVNLVICSTRYLVISTSGHCSSGHVRHLLAASVIAAIWSFPAIRLFADLAKQMTK